MDPVNLFDLATQQSRWLSVRQTAVAGNIANVNTPGYKAMDVESFDKVLDKTNVGLRGTNPRHLGADVMDASLAVRPDETQAAMMPSGNSVTLETELMKAGELRRSFELNTAIVKAFHRMMLTSVKG